MTRASKVAPLAWVAAQLDELPAAGLRREPVTIDGPMGPEVLVDGRPHLLLGSNNYLDLAGHPALVKGAGDALATHGAGTAASSGL